jgi:hypothetical protein
MNSNLLTASLQASAALPIVSPESFATVEEFVGPKL